jgi:ubiquinone/menaquinone biosynthesis C-methylase UbiE
MDIHPLAIKRVESIIAKRQLTNVVAFTSGGETGLEEASIDVVLLYDTFHDLNDPQGVLAELYRVLKPSGILSFSDHHMKQGEILLQLTVAGLFQLLARGKKTYTFTKVRAVVRR